MVQSKKSDKKQIDFTLIIFYDIVEVYSPYMDLSLNDLRVSNGFVCWDLRLSVKLNMSMK
jgi:hypothetical protein